MKNNPELKTSPAKATADINDRIDKGEQLRTMPINIEINEFFDNLNRDYDSWNKYNGQMLNIMFTTEEISKEYLIHIPTIYRREPSIGMKIEILRKNFFEKIGRLKSIQDRLNLFSIATDETQPQEKAPVKPHTHSKKIFIGHGRSLIWRELKDFIEARLKLPADEFNRVPVAGVTNIERLSEMLEGSAIAFLIMTGEDEQPDGKLHARMNVVHEAGLFQGRLGFKRAIVLLEEGCESFSNIEGLGQLRFPKGQIKAKFEEIREILEREDLLNLNEDPLFKGIQSEGTGEVEISNTQIPQLTKEARLLLKETSTDPEGTLHYFRYPGGVKIKTNGKTLISSNELREVAFWEAAFKELVNENLLRELDSEYRGEFFQITHLGYQIADNIEL